MDNNAPLERVFDRLISPFEQFIHDEAASGLVLMACTVLALVVANTALLGPYQHILHMPITLSLGGWELQKTLHHWINDGLMSLFFFIVGLEIKREVLVGELSDIRQAMLPIIAAIGGMVVPALVYTLVNHGGAMDGWGIPMATDIAFAVGVLVLLGSRIPKSLITFLVALAIVDDLGGVIVIALFYTENIQIDALLLAGVFFALLVLLNRAGVRKPLPYFLIGGLLWLAMLKSGVHATLAGVLTALTIPARTKYEAGFFSGHVRSLMDYFEEHHHQGLSIMRNHHQARALQTLENAVHKVQTPLMRLEHSLHLPVAFIIIPLFALANAGIPIDFSQLEQALIHPVTLGVILGLVVGKSVGIAGICWVALKLGWGQLPEGTRFSHIVGASLLGGIGFTMSIFIAELGFSHNQEYLLMAKTGVLVASILAGALGMWWLSRIASRD